MARSQAMQATPAVVQAATRKRGDQQALLPNACSIGPASAGTVRLLLLRTARRIVIPAVQCQPTRHPCQRLWTAAGALLELFKIRQSFEPDRPVMWTKKRLVATLEASAVCNRAVSARYKWRVPV